MAIQTQIRRYWAMPSPWTFSIRPIKELLDKYVGDGKGWVDPFAGMYSPAEFTNDLNPKMPTKYHLDAKDFCESIEGVFEGVIIDPPYSYRQVSEHYKTQDIAVTQLDTSSNFYNRVMNAIYRKIKLGGYAISCGWNSTGFGRNRGFKMIEILMVCHGGHHNDTIVTVEQKYREQLIMPFMGVNENKRVNINLRKEGGKEKDN